MAMSAIPVAPVSAELASLVNHLSGQRVIVLGDMVADEYLIGRPARLSREAPIPILELTDRYIVPGGGANVAANLRSLGADVAVAGVIGHDSAGQELCRLLQTAGIDTDGLYVDAGRPTSTKTRIIGGSSQQVHQQVARIDHVDSTEIDGDAKKYLMDYLTRRLPGTRALLISDYEAGVINPVLIETVLPLAREQGIITTVDSHAGLLRFKHVTVATPNEPEAAASANHHVQSTQDLYAVGKILLEGMAAQGILITRGSEGMALFERDGQVHILPAIARSEVRDTAGAGDTVAATFTLALIAGATMLQAAQLSNIAAGLVVRKFGVATVTNAELAASLREQISHHV